MTALEFAELHVERYLLPDIQTLIRARPAEGDYGACGYSLLMAVFSGVELLGALSSKDKFEIGKRDEELFALFWRGYLYPRDPSRAQAGKGLYFLARHGIAHAFRVAGNIEVWKGSPQRHLTRNASGTVFIDAAELGNDFVSAYQAWKADLMAGRLPEADGRVQEILGEQGRKNATHSPKLDSLPLLSPGTPEAETAPTGTLAPAHSPISGLVSPTFKTN
jgi:hypothetical protein